MSETSNRYYPDYAVPPGRTLRETIEALGMSQVELAERTGRPKKTINGIVMGKVAITPETAIQLENVLGVPASFWNSLERQYQEQLARKDELARLAQQLGWVTQFPTGEMIKRGWIRKQGTRIQLLQELLRFFGVASVQQWRVLWLKPNAAYRRSSAFEISPEATAAWLRRGEIEAQEINCAPFDHGRFRGALAHARTMTQQPPELFVPAVVAACAKAGVAVRFVRGLPKTRVSGATRWLNPGKALLQLSLRYKTDDQLWFTFFHESAHILLHGKGEVFLEGDGSTATEVQEAQADTFARDSLIDPQDWERFTSGQTHFSHATICSLATQIGIAPGIIVGRLQHEKLLDHRFCNDLKRPLQWPDDATVPALDSGASCEAPE